MPQRSLLKIRSLRWAAPFVVAGFVMLAPDVASADTIMLMMHSGPENSERMALLSQDLREAGHKPMVTGASLEDSALMLGCDASKGACIDLVIETGGAGGAIIVPQDTGELLVRRGGVAKTEKVTAGASDYDWRLALSKAFGLPAPPAPVVATPKGADFSAGSGGGQSGGFFQISKVKKRSWIVLGSGAATSVVGLVLLNVASGKQDDVNNHPVDTAADLEALRDLESSGESLNRAGNIIFFAGGIATLAGVGLAVWDMKSGSDEGGPTFVPTASETDVGVALRWDSW
jgi:hypothetical protein